MSPALWGAAALVAVGVLLVLASVLLHAGRVGELTSSLGAGAVGQTVLALTQLLVLPDLAMWAVAFVAGPGFTLVSGSSVSWSGSQPGTLPVIPVLGALPDPGALPGWLPLLAFLPVAAGAFVAWRSQRSMSAFTSWRLRAEATGTACLLCTALLTVLAWAANGSLGAARLSGVGPRVALTGVALLGELVLGALVAGFVLGRRARRRFAQRS